MGSSLEVTKPVWPLSPGRALPFVPVTWELLRQEPNYITSPQFCQQKAAARERRVGETQEHRFYEVRLLSWTNGCSDDIMEDAGWRLEIGSQTRRPRCEIY